MKFEPMIERKSFRTYIESAIFYVKKKIYMYKENAIKIG